MSWRGAALVCCSAALVLAGCGGAPLSSRQRVAQWAGAAPWDADNALIRSDLRDLDDGLRAHQLLALRTACEGGLSADAATLYNTLPTPDQRLTNELNRALVAFGEAARDCYDSPSFGSSEFDSYRRALAAGRGAYRAAVQRLASFGVR